VNATEDRARAAMRAIAATVNDAPPLELGQRGQGAGGRAGTGSPARGPGRRWRSWAAPLTAAAVITAVAISLVLVRNLPGGSGAPAGPATATSGPAGSLPAGVPRYYVALKQLPPKKSTSLDAFQYAVVVADSVTGETLATFTPPANTIFQSVTAAADDRTFAVLAVSPAERFQNDHGTVTGSWYKLVITPGNAGPDRVRLTRLPVKPWSWTAALVVNAAPAPGQIYASALSASGQELAVADVPAVAAASKPQNWIEVKVFSVATGRLLHSWTADDPDVRLTTARTIWQDAVPLGATGLTWIDGDRALAVATSSGGSGPVTGTVRKLDLTGPASGSLLADSTVLWSGPLSTNGNGRGGGFTLNDWPPQVTADGKSITGLSYTSPYATPGDVDFGTFPLGAGTADDKLTPVYRVQAVIPPRKENSQAEMAVLWVSPSGNTMIVCVAVSASTASFPQSARFLVVSRGRSTPLAIPVSMVASMTLGIAF